MLKHEPHNPDDDNDIVDRATAALRDARVPDGPPADLLAKTRSALAQAQAAGNHLDHTSQPTTSFRQRFLTMKNLTRLAIAAVLVLFVGIFVWTGGPWGGQPAFADVLQKVNQVRSVRLKSIATVNLAGIPGPKTVEVTMLMTNDRMRQEMFGGVVNVFDFNTRQALTLVTPLKKAFRIQIENLPPNTRDQNVIEKFRSMRPEQGKPIGRKEIDGRPADGFDVVEDGQKMTIWTDPDTRLPILMEVNIDMPAVPKSQVVMKDFQWDVPFAPSDFSLEVPEGYDVQEMTYDVSAPKEKDLIDSFRALSSVNGGAFLDTLDMAGMFSALRNIKSTFPSGKIDDKKMIAELTRVQMLFMRGALFVNKENGSDFHYAGNGAKLNDPDRPIFWYRPPNSETYRIIYADLTVKQNVPAADLPKLDSQKLSPTPDFFRSAQAPTTRPAAPTPATPN